ncbi:hypothetical protein N4844_16065, partial [Enterococcus faecalis]|uniref:hypothetical protein n=1 Tax=Enterococcus faecalis TaxID=1351 RepID=UPI0021DF8047
TYIPILRVCCLSLFPVLAGVFVNVLVTVVVYFFAYLVVDPVLANEILVLAASTLLPQLFNYVPAPSLSPSAMPTASAAVCFNSI